MLTASIGSGYGDVLRRKKLLTKQRMLRRHRLREQQRKERVAAKKRLQKERAAAVQLQMESMKGVDGADMDNAVDADAASTVRILPTVEEEEEAPNAVLELSDDEEEEDEEDDDVDDVEEEDLKLNEEEMKELEDVAEDDIASYLKTPVALKLSDYDDFAKEWLQRVTAWNVHVEALRSSSPLMNYFTINNVRTLIDQINRILKQALKSSAFTSKAKVCCLCPFG